MTPRKRPQSPASKPGPVSACAAVLPTDDRLPSSTSADTSEAGGGGDHRTSSGAPVSPCRADSREALLRAGLTALDNVRNDVVRHHTDMIERLLGIQRQPSGGPFVPTLGLGPLESFGLRAFEDVFDQRVASALLRLGYPSATQLQAMRDELSRLREQVDDLQARVLAQDEAADARFRRKAAVAEPPTQSPKALDKSGELMRRARPKPATVTATRKRSTESD